MELQSRFEEDKEKLVYEMETKMVNEVQEQKAAVKLQLTSKINALLEEKRQVLYCCKQRLKTIHTCTLCT